jgi:hypothetical protein
MIKIIEVKNNSKLIKSSDKLLHGEIFQKVVILRFPVLYLQWINFIAEYARRTFQPLVD